MKTKPFKHQLKEFTEHATTPARALLWQMRCGKSKLVIDTACDLASLLEIDGVLVIAPNGVHLNWKVREIPAHHWDEVTFKSFVWRFSNPTNKKDFEDWVTNKYSRADLSWFCVNMEVLHRDDVKKAVMTFIQRTGRVMVVYDECHHFAHPGTKRTKAARGIAKLCPYRRGLTGTPVENSPMQAFSQFELMEPGALGFTNYKDFCDHYVDFEPRRARSGGRYEVVQGYKNLPELRERMAKYSSVVLRSDCEDLPAVQRDIRYVEMTDRQLRLWNQIKKQEAETLIKLGFTNVPAGGALLTKLQQIEGGWLKVGAIIGPVEMDGSVTPKLEALVDEVEQHDGPVLVWCQYIHEIHEAFKLLASKGRRVRKFFGGMDAAERDAVKAEFQRGQLGCLVAQPQAGSEGHDFSAASKIVWYSQTADATVRSQAMERCTKVGKGSVQSVDLIVRGGTDEHYLGLTDAKTTLAEEISRRGMKAILDELEVTFR